MLTSVFHKLASMQHTALEFVAMSSPPMFITLIKESPLLVVSLFNSKTHLQLCCTWLALPRMPVATADLPHLWVLYESCSLNTVANLFRNKLLELYHCIHCDDDNQQAPFRAAFIE